MISVWHSSIFTTAGLDLNYWFVWVYAVGSINKHRT